MKTPMHRIKKFVYHTDHNVQPYWYFDNIPCWFGSGVVDKNLNEICEGDILDIDFDKAQDFIGEGSLIVELKAMRPPNARLVVEFYAARFRLVWRTKNGGVDTGKDLALLAPIGHTIEVIGHIAEVAQ